MTPRQAEIAAEAFVASQLARCGYDVLVQYGANQPDYDLVALKDALMVLVSVKGSQDGGWALAVSQVTAARGCSGNQYHQAIDLWLEKQRRNVMFFFVQFQDIELHQQPRFYIASPCEIAVQMKSQRNGNGHGALHEDYRRDHPKSRYDNKIPCSWKFTPERLDSLASKIIPRI